jgi:prepilin signal peptidase PulO-like enzyme (type II secretory pathway)
MTPLIEYLAVAAVAVPVGGAYMLARTYRTDPALRGLPVPKITILTHAVAIGCAVLLIWFGPAIGWEIPAALAFALILAMAFSTDAAGRVLPDILTCALAIVGMIASIAGLGLSIGSASAGLVGVGVGLWFVRLRLIRAYGPDAFCLGDYKLVTASAAIISVQHIACAIIMAGGLGILLSAWRWVRPSADNSLPFGSLYVAGLILFGMAATSIPKLAA